jgi:hypothetical protein
MDVECLLYLEQRLNDLEKRLLYHEEKEYYKYLVAGQNKKVLETMFFIEHEPVKKEVPKRNMLWMNYHK